MWTCFATIKAKATNKSVKSIMKKSGDEKRTGKTAKKKNEQKD
jgi:hypothetical protein